MSQNRNSLLREGKEKNKYNDEGFTHHFPKAKQCPDSI